MVPLLHIHHKVCTLAAKHKLQALRIVLNQVFHQAVLAELRHLEEAVAAVRSGRSNDIFIVKADGILIGFYAQIVFSGPSRLIIISAYLKGAFFCAWFLHRIRLNYGAKARTGLCKFPAFFFQGIQCCLFKILGVDIFPVFCNLKIVKLSDAAGPLIGTAQQQRFQFSAACGIKGTVRNFRAIDIKLKGSAIDTILHMIPD